jgi:hypothetical protein
MFVEELELQGAEEALGHAVGPRRRQHPIPQVMSELFG